MRVARILQSKITMELSHYSVKFEVLHFNRFRRREDTTGVQPDAIQSCLRFFGYLQL